MNDLSRQPDFEAYPLASHLTYRWLGGKLRRHRKPFRF